MSSSTGTLRAYPDNEAAAGSPRAAEERIPLKTYLAIALAALAFAPASTAAEKRPELVKIGDGSTIRAIRDARADTWRCQTDLGRRRSGVEYRAERSPSLSFRRWTLRLWRSRANRCEAERSALRAAYVVSEPWRSLAACESGGRWSYNGSSGFDGGLQFHPGTWSAYRRPGDPPYAYLATPAAQVAVAERVLAVQGFGAWPACSRLLGLR